MLADLIFVSFFCVTLDTYPIYVQKTSSQGCAGGNPLFAFYFLHHYGVTSKRTYPYTAKKDTCSVPKVDQPVAKVESWGILTPDHEDNMEKVLRFIGPGE